MTRTKTAFRIGRPIVQTDPLNIHTGAHIQNPLIIQRRLPNKYREKPPSPEDSSPDFVNPRISRSNVVTHLLKLLSRGSIDFKSDSFLEDPSINNLMVSIFDSPNTKSVSSSDIAEILFKFIEKSIHIDQSLMKIVASKFSQIASFSHSISDLPTVSKLFMFCKIRKDCVAESDSEKIKNQLKYLLDRVTDAELNSMTATDFTIIFQSLGEMKLTGHFIIPKIIQVLAGKRKTIDLENAVRLLKPLMICCDRKSSDIPLLKYAIKSAELVILNRIVLPIYVSEDVFRGLELSENKVLQEKWRLYHEWLLDFYK
jgi:hypothetical protein